MSTRVIKTMFKKWQSVISLSAGSVGLMSSYIVHYELISASRHRATVPWALHEYLLNEWIKCKSPYLISGAATTKYHRLGEFNNGYLFSHSCGGWKSKVKMPTGLVSSKATLLPPLHMGSPLCTHIPGTSLCALTYSPKKSHAPARNELPKATRLVAKLTSPPRFSCLHKYKKTQFKECFPPHVCPCCPSCFHLLSEFGNCSFFYVSINQYLSSWNNYYGSKSGKS